MDSILGDSPTNLAINSDGRLGEVLRLSGHYVIGVDVMKLDGVVDRLNDFVEADLGAGIPVEVGKDFDAVLEQYPKGNKTADAFYYKGVSLVKMGRSRDARKEFTTVIQQFPRTEAADKARSQMKALGFNTPAKGKK